MGCCRSLKDLSLCLSSTDGLFPSQLMAELLTWQKRHVRGTYRKMERWRDFGYLLYGLAFLIFINIKHLSIYVVTVHTMCHQKYFNTQWYSRLKINNISIKGSLLITRKRFPCNSCRGSRKKHLLLWTEDGKQTGHCDTCGMSRHNTSLRCH